MNTDNFIGLNNFVWWFGVVEDRNDPLQVGRCRVRCFGWHSEDKVVLPTANLPWAQPIIPYGSQNVQPPPEGTWVFGFFADGKEGRFPIIIGSTKGIPESAGNPEEGFTDPYTDAQKAVNPFLPRKVKSSTVSSNASGPKIVNNTPKRFPEHLDEPNTSRLSRPDRVEGDDGSSLGVRSASILGTAIDIQRKNRIKYVKSGKTDKILSTNDKRVQTVWDEPFPSFNPKYPYNHAVETESGHAFEMDDTKDYERVQLSHRTGSTLEFLPSGSVKQKTFNNKYDVTMGSHKSYVAGEKDETVQSNMFLRINGKLVIQCDGIDFESSGDINMMGQNVKITSKGDLDIQAVGSAKFYGASGVDVRTEGPLKTYGGSGAVHNSGGLTEISGTFNPVAAAVKQAIQKATGKTPTGIEETDLINCGVKVSGPNFFISTVTSSWDTVITNILPPVSITPKSKTSAAVAAKYKAPTPAFKPTTPTNKKEKTDGMAFQEQKNVGTLDLPKQTNAANVTTVVDTAMKDAANKGQTDKLTNLVPQNP